MSGDAATFAACASHPSLGAEVAHGSVVFDRWRLRFVSAQLVLEIPLTRLQLEMDPAQAGEVCFSDPDQADCSIRVFDVQVLEHSALRQQTHTRSQLQALRNVGELKSRLKLTAWFLGGFALVAVLASLLAGVMVRSLVGRIPAQWEQELGDQLVQDLRLKATFVEDAKLQARLESAVAPLLSALPKADFPYKFYILEEPLPNAFALPGGHVFVTTSLLDLANQQEEIAGVVAHEIAHVTLRHGFRKLISAAGPYLIFRFFIHDSGGFLGMLGQSSQLLVRQSFSQEYELEADAIGWDYLVSARIDPRGMTEMLGKFEAEQRRLQSLGMPAPKGAFSSHPATEKRIRRLAAKWEKIKDKSAFEQPDRTE